MEGHSKTGNASNQLFLIARLDNKKMIGDEGDEDKTTVQTSLPLVTEARI